MTTALLPPEEVGHEETETSSLSVATLSSPWQMDEIATVSGA